MITDRLIIFLVDNNPDDRQLAKAYLQPEFPQASFVEVGTSEELDKALEQFKPDLVITDYRLNWSDGLEVMQQVRARYPDCPVIMFTDSAGEEIAVEAMKKGLKDYILKSRMKQLVRSVRVFMEHRQIQQERERARVELRRINRLLRALYDNAKEMIMILDPVGRLLSFNRQLEHFAGLPEHKLKFKCLDEIFGEQEKPIIEAISRVVQTGKPMGFEHDLTWDGRKYAIDTHLYPLFDEDGQVEAVGLICYDITQRKEMEERLRQSENLLRQVLEELPLGVAIVVEGRTVFYNQRALALISTPETRNEVEAIIKNSHFLEFVHPDDRSRVEEIYRKRLRGEPVPSVYEIRINPAYGKAWVEVHATKMDYMGKTGILVVLVDVTERKRLEQMLVRSQKMEAVGRLAGGIAHDVNNLLTPILGAVEMMSYEFGGDERIEKHLNIIREVVDKARNLTRQLLIFSRRDLVSPERMNLNELIERFRQIFPRIMGEDIQWKLVLAPELPDIYAAPGHVEQILLNLLVNARDAMQEGGTVYLRTIILKVDEEDRVQYPDLKPGEYVVLEVADTGTGMPPEVMEHIFEPFFTTKEEGSGMGLATVYAVMQQLGGQIHVYSELGKGTIFRLYFPAFHEDHEYKKDDKKVKTMKKELPRGEETILVLEDQDEVRRITVEFLRYLNYRVYDAATIKEAKSLLQKLDRPVDLLLCDVVLGDGRGPDFYNSIREQYPGMKVIFMSGYPSDITGQKWWEEKGHAFILKPFNYSDLAWLIRKILDE